MSDDLHLDCWRDGETATIANAFLEEGVAVASSRTARSTCLVTGRPSRTHLRPSSDLVFVTLAGLVRGGTSDVAQGDPDPRCIAGP